MNKWLNYKDLNPELKEELLKLTEEELSDAFYTNLGFGTGGMRGIVGPGTNRMNIYTLRKTNYGYGKYLLKYYQNPLVVIAYDSRNKSLEFAQDSAVMLANLGVKVLLFKKITPTPELSFAVRHLKASGGIVITASHNPPQYNGYKVYDEDGCQLVPALVEKLTEEINQAPDMFTFKVKSYDELVELGLIAYVDDQVDDAYLNMVKMVAVFPNIKKDIKVVYTPLHGTGAILGKRLLDELGFEFICVEEQMVPDPLFSTVKSPNPEDNKAFELGLRYAKNYQADLIVATDPDADRVGIAILVNNEYKFLTGNQVGAILIYYLCNYRYFDGVLFNTVVTSDIGAKIAMSYGVKVVSTLTGFKFIGEQAKLIEKNNQAFFFGYEESYGYVVKDFVRDKDSLQAMTLICDALNYYKSKHKTFQDVLEEIYEKFGYYQDGIVNLTFMGEAGAKQIENILEYFRNNEFSELNISVKEDYLLSKRYGKTISDIELPKSNFLKYILADGSWFVLRPSGTEPKMKIYLCTVGKTREESLLKETEIKNKVLAIIERVNQ